MNTQTALKSINTPTTPTFEQQVISKLDAILARIEEVYEKVEALEVRVSDMDLDTGGGFEID